MTDHERSEDPPNKGAPPAAEDVSLGLRFLHLMATEQQARLAELSASFYALLETLVAEGRVAPKNYEQRRKLAILRENERVEQDAGIEIAAIPNKYALEGLPEIDCEALLPICQGRCCKLPMLLSVQDLDEHVVRWQYARPYVIAQNAAGRCVHQTEQRCGVYANRPGACRIYDCRTDPRIWKDFDRRIPAD